MKRKFLSVFITLLLISSVFSTIAVAIAESVPFAKPNLMDLVEEDTSRLTEELPSSGTFTVTFNSNGGKLVPHPSSETVDAGETLTVSEYAPSKTGYFFESWCLDTEGFVEWDFNDPVYQNMTLYAKYNTGIQYTQIKALTITADYAKYNTSRESVLRNTIISNVRARYVGQVVDVIIKDNSLGTLVKNATTGLYPTGLHTITLTTKVNEATNTFNYVVNVAAADANKVYVVAKASLSDLGSTGSSYFAGATKNIGVNIDNYFDLADKKELTDYKITNAGARGLYGLPEEFLNSKNHLKSFSDPILIRNNTDTDIWFKPEGPSSDTDDRKASYLFLDSQGIVKMGYSGADAVMIDEAHPTAELKLTNARSAFVTNRKIEAGGYLLVINGNNNEGNFYIGKTDLPSGTTSTYNYDGRQFVYNTMMYRYGNAVQVRTAPTGGSLISGAYTNQLPYMLKGSSQIVGIVDENITINAAYVLNGVEIYDDNSGLFQKDKLVTSGITVAFAKLTSETDDITTLTYSTTPVESAVTGLYSAKITVKDDVTNSEVHFYRSIRIKEVDNDFSYYMQDGKKVMFQHDSQKSGDTVGVKFNTAYLSTSPYKNSLFVYSHTSTQFFGTDNCNWAAILIVDQNGNVKIAVEPTGDFYGADGEKIGKVEPTANMVGGLVKHMTGTESTTVVSVQNLIRTACGTDPEGTNGTYYMLIYPNVGSSRPESPSRQFVWDFILKFVEDTTLTIHVKGTGVSIGL